jgi:uncharacterized protein
MFIGKDGQRLIVPPFTDESARAKVNAAEDAWNSRDPERVALAYAEGSVWRNRTEFFSWPRGDQGVFAPQVGETQYRLMKELWCYQGNRISVRFEYEFRRSAESMDARTWQRALGVR